MVLDDISCDIQTGEVLSIVGPSGAGKTTLLRCVTGLETLDAGSITIHGVPLSTYLQLHRVALISQQYSNFPWMTVRENIAIAYHAQQKTASDIDDTVGSLLHRFQLHRFQNYYPHQLSGGMQQRVAIARALAQNAELIVLDEPFGALDAHTRAQAQEFFTQLIEEEHKTILIVTHDIDEALYLSDRVIVLGSHPGTIRNTITVPLARPRRNEMRFTSEFTQIKKSIHYMIRSNLISASVGGHTLTTIGDPLTLGLYIWSGNTPLYIAKENGLFAGRGLNPTIVSSEQNTQRILQWRNDEIDVLDVTLDTAIELNAQIPDTTIIMPLTKSNGSDALIVRNNITSLTDLRGKRIGLERGAVSQFLLTCILQSVGLSLRDVRIVDMKSSEAGAALIAGAIDGAVLWEPWLTKAQELSQTTVLASSVEFPFLYDVLIAKQSTIQRKQQEIEALKNVWLDALTVLEQKPLESIAHASSLLGVSDRELNETLKKIQFFQSFPQNFSQIISKIQSILIKDGRVKSSDRSSLF